MGNATSDSKTKKQLKTSTLTQVVALPAPTEPPRANGKSQEPDASRQAQNSASSQPSSSYSFNQPIFQAAAGSEGVLSSGVGTASHSQQAPTVTQIAANSWISDGKPPTSSAATVPQVQAQNAANQAITDGGWWSSNAQMPIKDLASPSGITGTTQAPDGRLSPRPAPTRSVTRNNIDIPLMTKGITQIAVEESTSKTWPSPRKDAEQKAVQTKQQAVAPSWGGAETKVLHVTKGSWDQTAQVPPSLAVSNWTDKAPGAPLSNASGPHVMNQEQQGAHAYKGAGSMETQQGNLDQKMGQEESNRPAQSSLNKSDSTPSLQGDLANNIEVPLTRRGSSIIEVQESQTWPSPRKDASPASFQHDSTWSKREDQKDASFKSNHAEPPSYGSGSVSKDWGNWDASTSKWGRHSPEPKGPSGPELFNNTGQARLRRSGCQDNLGCVSLYRNLARKKDAALRSVEPEPGSPRLWSLDKKDKKDASALRVWSSPVLIQLSGSSPIESKSGSPKFWSKFSHQSKQDVSPIWDFAKHPEHSRQNEGWSNLAYESSQSKAFSTKGSGIEVLNFGDRKPGMNMLDSAPAGNHFGSPISSSVKVMSASALLDDMRNQPKVQSPMHPMIAAVNDYSEKRAENRRVGNFSQPGDFAGIYTGSSRQYEALDLIGQRVLITDATEAIGTVCAFRFAELGCDLILLGTDISELQKLGNELDQEGFQEVRRRKEAEGGRQLQVDLVGIDVRDTNCIHSLAMSIGPVDILINNACMSFLELEKNNSPLDQNEHDMLSLVYTSMISPMTFTSAFGYYMKERGSGHIINVENSPAEQITENSAVHCSAVAGLEAFTTGARHDLVDTPIRVSSISPGYMRSGSHTVGKNDCMPLLPEDIADQIVYTCTRPTHVQIASISTYCTNQAHMCQKGLGTIANVGPSLGFDAPQMHSFDSPLGTMSVSASNANPSVPRIHDFSSVVPGTVIEEKQAQHAALPALKVHKLDRQHWTGTSTVRTNNQLQSQSSAFGEPICSRNPACPTEFSHSERFNMRSDPMLSHIPMSQPQSSGSQQILATHSQSTASGELRDFVEHRGPGHFAQQSQGPGHFAQQSQGSGHFARQSPTAPFGQQLPRVSQEPFASTLSFGKGTAMASGAPPAHPGDFDGTYLPHNPQHRPQMPSHMVSALGTDRRNAD